jgi:hypothetical protein
MFGKSLAIVLALGLMATALLSMRHQRFEQVAGISRGHWRLQEQERDIGRRRAAVAAAVKPDAVRKAIAALKLDWQPIPNRLDAPNPPTQPRLATRQEPVAERDQPRVEFGG